MADDETNDKYDVPDPGDLVVATNMNGETAGGEVVEVLDKACGEYILSPRDPNDPKVTLREYWDHNCGHDEPVVKVQLSGGQYDYPASQLEQADPEEVDDDV